MKRIVDFLFSYVAMALFLVTLALGAAVATFIENDYGTSTARVLVYNHIWYEAILTLTVVNILGIIYKRKMWNKPAKFIFHFSFVVILIGAGVTRYFGYEGIMHIREGSTQNKMISLEPYLQITVKENGVSYYEEFPLELSALGNNFDYNLQVKDKELDIKYTDYMFAKKGKNTMGILTVNVSYNGVTKDIKLPGKRGIQGVPKVEDFGGTEIKLEYGSKVLEIPFSVKLNDFQLERYPGSMAPSSYASEVTVINPDGEEYDYRIFMNHTLHEGSFLFFQSSYDQDEKGTILSVNNDPGKFPTYFGYFLLTLGLVMNLFDKKGRFWQLSKYLKKNNLLSIAIAISTLFMVNNAEAKEYKSTVEYMKNFKENSGYTAKNFSLLVSQTNGGRMRPISSLNRDIVNKLSGKDELFGMNADQIILGMISRPEIWRYARIIKIKTPKLKKILGIDEKRKFIAFTEVFKDGKFLLQQETELANRMQPGDRGTYERDIIKVNERLNVAYLVFNGNLFKIFPKVTEAGQKNDGRWYTPLEGIQYFSGENRVAVEAMTKGFVNSVYEENWDLANQFIDNIRLYQHKVGADEIISDSQIENEILFNELNIFVKLMVAYIIVGFIILIAAFVTVFKPKFQSKLLTQFFFIVLALLFAMHTFGMGFRWVISGHAPWSDTYESLLYISWSAIFAGVIFFRKSLLALSAAVIVAGIFMFTAHLSHIDPQITNLVPVLKSYWLTIHVSILTASYGFFGLSAILGFMSLVIFIFRGKGNKPHLDDNIRHMAAINEMSLIIGLSAITIGNFLGGVWANESWGRYWGWDPKETWAYVSIVIYALVIHLRFMKKLNNPYTLSVASLLAFSSILMTYFGVNFYLSGLHSYATGDPVPIPTWVYFVTALVFATIALSFKNRDLSYKKEN